jgi:amino acid permease
MNRFLKSSAIIVAASIGSGIFALPYVFYRAGWLLCLIYFAVLVAIVSVAHAVYLRTLEKVGEKERLLGLARKYFGKAGFWAGFLAIVIGLLLSFVIFLILGAQFVRLIIPSLPPLAAIMLFWFLIAAPVFLRDRRAMSFEIFGVFLIVAVIIFVFISSQLAPVLREIPAIDFSNFFLPFGAILFSLAGWTGVEPIYELRKKLMTLGVSRTSSVAPLVIGTFFVALLYVMFAIGILVSASSITTDTVSGLASWSVWKKDIIAIFGLLALWTVSISLSREIRNALEKDLKWNHVVSRMIIIGLPLAVVLSGFNNFLVIIAITGGVFLSIQYLLIVSVGRRVLELSTAQKFLLDAVALVFLFAAVYSVYGFVVH